MTSMQKDAGVLDAIVRMLSRVGAGAGKGLARSAARMAPSSVSRILQAEAAGASRLLPLKAGVPISTAEMKIPMMATAPKGVRSPTAFAGTRLARVPTQAPVVQPVNSPTQDMTRAFGVPTGPRPPVQGGTRPAGLPTEATPGVSAVQTPVTGPGETYSLVPRILPPPSSVSRIPVLPPVPGTSAYLPKMMGQISQTGQHLREMELVKNMGQTLGPTGLPLGPMPNPGKVGIEQMMQDLPKSPFFSKVNALMERVKMSAFLEALDQAPDR